MITLLELLTISFGFISLCHGTSPVEADCPPGLPLQFHFVLTETGSCYFVDNKLYFRSDASKICEDEGGHLVHLETSEEENALDAKLRSLWAILPEFYWLGIERKSGSWKWTISKTGFEKPVTWTHWFIMAPVFDSFASHDPLLGWKGRSGILPSAVVCEIDISQLDRKFNQFSKIPGNYYSLFKPLMRSAVECAAKCSVLSDCKGVTYNEQGSSACRFLYDTQISGHIQTDCNKEICYLKNTST